MSDITHSRAARRMDRDKSGTLLVRVALLLCVAVMVILRGAPLGWLRSDAAGLAAATLASAALAEDAAPDAQATPSPDASPATTPCFPLATSCLQGPADYTYFDQRLAVQIQKHADGNLAYFVCDIQTTDPTALRTALSHDQPYGIHEYSSEIASRHGAVLAINGDDYGQHRRGVIIRDGQLIRAKGTVRQMLMLDPAGDLSVLADRHGEKPEALADRLLAAGIREAWEFGPELVRDGQAVPFPAWFDFISVKDRTLEPRTAIGQMGPLHYVVIVVDGRRLGYSGGISLPDLQQMFVDLGARTAFNLDGGGSTTLYFRGQVLNRPSGGEERTVSDILYF